MLQIEVHKNSRGCNIIIYALSDDDEELLKTMNPIGVIKEEEKSNDTHYLVIELQRIQ